MWEKSLVHHQYWLNGSSHCRPRGIVSEAISTCQLSFHLQSVLLFYLYQILFLKCVCMCVCVCMAIGCGERRQKKKLIKSFHHLSLELQVARKTQIGIFNLSSQHLAQHHPLLSLLLSPLLLASHYCWRRLHGKSHDKTIFLTSAVSSAHSLAFLSFIIIHAALE